MLDFCFRIRKGKKENATTIVNYPLEEEHCSEYPIPNRSFPRFTKVKDCQENKFRETPISKRIDQIYKECETFEKELPKSIYLRTYYERPDLFQAAIVGLPGTPYEDGIYVFDIKLPNNYPKKPPTVLYHSHPCKLKPSVIDSSSGHFRKRNAVFKTLDKSGKSILLQTLLYIQHKVLNGNLYSKHDYNDPSSPWKYEAEDKVEDKFDHHLISECPLPCYLYAYQSMIDILDDPPSLFQRLVCCHFLLRGDAICRAFEDTVVHHIKYGQDRGFYDFLANKMKVGRCYALPEGFSRFSIVKLRGNLARAFAENQATSLIVGGYE